MYFRTYGLPKTLFVKRLKSDVLEDPSTSNMINGPKRFWNLGESTFTIFIGPCEDSPGWKSFSEWYAKSYDCLLTHSLPIIGILFLTEPIYCNIFRCNYVRNERLFLNFFWHFLHLGSILNIFKKRTTALACAFLNLQIAKNGVR